MREARDPEVAGERRRKLKFSEATRPYEPGSNIRAMAYINGAQQQILSTTEIGSSIPLSRGRMRFTTATILVALRQLGGPYAVALSRTAGSIQ